MSGQGPSVSRNFKFSKKEQINDCIIGTYYQFGFICLYGLTLYPCPSGFSDPLFQVFWGIWLVWGPQFSSRALIYCLEWLIRIVIPMFLISLWLIFAKLSEHILEFASFLWWSGWIFCPWVYDKVPPLLSKRKLTDNLWQFLKTVKTTELRDFHSTALSVGIYRFPLLKHLVVEQFRKSVSNNPTNPFPISNILSRSLRHPPRAIGGLANCSFDTLSPIYCPQWCCSDAPCPTMVEVHRGRCAEVQTGRFYISLPPSAVPTARPILILSWGARPMYILHCAPPCILNARRDILLLLGCEWVGQTREESRH